MSSTKKERKLKFLMTSLELKNWKIINFVFSLKGFHVAWNVFTLLNKVLMLVNWNVTALLNKEIHFSAPWERINYSSDLTKKIWLGRNFKKKRKYFANGIIISRNWKIGFWGCTSIILSKRHRSMIHTVKLSTARQ